MKSATEQSDKLMAADIENSIRQEQVESFGRMMAGFSHDMKNHLGTIREANGLMSDLIAMGGTAADDPLVQRLTKAINSIESRVVIVGDMLHHLSRLSHRSDTPYSSFLVNDLIMEECTFLERFSRLKQVNFTLELAEGLPTIYNEPSLLQHVFYRLHSLCLEQMGPGDTLVVITRQHENAIEIVFRLKRDKQTFNDLFSDTLQAAVLKLFGSLETVSHSREMTDVVLRVPPLSAD